MNVAEIKYNDIANGLGVRTSIFVSGCRHHCKNCFNEIAWDFNYGKPFDEEIEEKILKSIEPSWINGLSILGGEPFEPENQGELLKLLEDFRKKFADKKNVWCYSGFTLEEILGEKESRAFTPDSKKMLEQIDILVDGPYVEDLHDITLKFRGSSNQRVINVKETLNNNKIIPVEL